MVNDNFTRRINTELNKDLRGELEQKNMEFKPRMETCWWCHKEFQPSPDGMNLAYLGGHGMVYGCDSCLGLVPMEVS